MADKPIFEYAYPNTRAMLLDIMRWYSSFTIEDIEQEVKNRGLANVTNGQIRTALSRLVDGGLMSREKWGVYTWDIT